MYRVNRCIKNKVIRENKFVCCAHQIHISIKNRKFNLPIEIEFSIFSYLYCECRNLKRIFGNVYIQYIHKLDCCFCNQ